MKIRKVIIILLIKTTKLIRQAVISCGGYRRNVMGYEGYQYATKSAVPYPTFQDTCEESAVNRGDLRD